jgi:hypothetical protein
MARFSPILLGLLVLVGCLNNAVAGLSVEEQLQQLRDNYVS